MTYQIKRAASGILLEKQVLGKLLLSQQSSLQTMEEGKFEIMAKGSNSEIVLYDGIILKMVDVKYGKHTRHLQNQYLIMKHLDHPFILPCIGYKKGVDFTVSIALSEGTRDVLMLEYAQLGSLLSYIKTHRLSGPQKMEIIRQICEALDYLHTIKGIAHRDIKLDNILLKQSQSGKLIVQLSDFGFAIQGDPLKPDLKAHSCKGTRRGYMPPQLHSQTDKPKPYVAHKLDIFSFGVVIFALVFGKLPFQFATPTDKYFGLICNESYEEFWLKHKISDEAWKQAGCQDDLKQLLHGMWKKEPDERFNIQQVKQSTWLLFNFK